ncbi:MAG: hypothetical protein AAF243_13280 [Cyanobacteria bacterium P01_A01_bin.137]
MSKPATSTKATALVAQSVQAAALTATPDSLFTVGQTPIFGAVMG